MPTLAKQVASQLNKQFKIIYIKYRRLVSCKEFRRLTEDAEGIDARKDRNSAGSVQPAHGRAPTLAAIAGGLPTDTVAAGGAQRMQRVA